MIDEPARSAPGVAIPGTTEERQKLLFAWKNGIFTQNHIKSSSGRIHGYANV